MDIVIGTGDGSLLFVSIIGLGSFAAAYSLWGGLAAVAWTDVIQVILLIFGGLILRFTLSLTGQSWARSHAQTVAFMVLPVITYVITKTIAGNIALSLGMIGALSIVRFRHPVKSALELIMYFDLITIGIATIVRTKWAIQLILCTIIIIIAVKIVQIIYQNPSKRSVNLTP